MREEDGEDLRTVRTLRSMVLLTVMLTSSSPTNWNVTQKRWVISWAMGNNLVCVSAELMASKVMKPSRMEEGNQLSAERRAAPYTFHGPPRQSGCFKALARLSPAIPVTPTTSATEFRTFITSQCYNGEKT